MARRKKRRSHKKSRRKSHRKSRKGGFRMHDTGLRKGIPDAIINRRVKRLGKTKGGRKIIAGVLKTYG